MIITGTRVRGGRYYGGTATAGDTYFNLVSLLLPGNGTNGAQNNTFLDSSTNAFTITRNGNTTQGTFSPFSQTGWSNYFDGTGDYLTLSSNTSMDFGTGNFTIEGWFYTGSKDISGGASRTIIGNSGNGYTMQVYITTSGYLTFGNTGSTFIQGSTDLADNAWHHFAIARKGTGTNEIAMWIDGVRVAQGTNSQNYTSGTIFLGSFDASNGFWNGYLSNLRIVKGTAVYDASNSTITVPTSPLTAIANTSLLTCQSNRFVDNSTNAFAITVNGNTSVQAFAPFDPTADYSTTTVGGSAYFDGTGDYLTAGNNNALAVGSGDFTLEAWVYITGGTYNSIYDTRASSSDTTGYVFAVQTGAGGNGAYLFNNPAGVIAQTGNSTVFNNGWNHVAFSRSGTSLRGFVNGVLLTTVTNSTNFSSLGPTTPVIGNNYEISGDPFVGYLSNFRIVKGTAVYTSTFTPPTAPLTAIANTSLLLNYTNGGITDAAAKNVLETVGSAQISTAQSKFGGSSIYLDGTGDYLTFPSSQGFAMRTGDFTFEGWVYATGSDAADATGIFQQGTSLFPTSSTNSLAVAIRPVSATIRWHTYAKNTFQDSTATVSLNTWYHFAFVRNGTTTTLYIDGSSVITVTSDNTDYTGTFLGVGSIYGTVNTNWEGYIDDLRITRGYARYTANFTPPTQAFPTQ